jgi:hypothetical protein
MQCGGDRLWRQNAARAGGSGGEAVEDKEEKEDSRKAGQGQATGRESPPRDAAMPDGASFVQL